MAKQRPSSRVAPKKLSKAPAKAARPAAKAAKAAHAARAASAPSARRTPAPAAKKTPARAAKKTVRPAAKAGASPRKSALPAPDAGDRNMAVELFEKGFRSLQQRRFQEAAQLFNAVIAQYPDEKELLERTRVYLAVCNRHAAPPDATPKTFDERLYAATLSVNRGAYDEGLSLLASLERDQPDHDHVQYLLAVVRAQRGEADAALAHLQKAIDLRPSLRIQAGTDIDLEPLHDNQAFNTLLDPARVPAARQRTGR
jgi:tetratricopeptide (TPR) repeat protein